MQRMTTLFVARHGETLDNAAQRWQGWRDSPLSARGIAQAQALARRLASEPLAAIYSSDLGRALQTAHIVATPHGLAPCPEPALRERASVRLRASALLLASRNRRQMPLRR